MKKLKVEILSEIKQAVLAVDANAELILFGSRARKDNESDSDWDVLILTDSEVNLKFKNKISDNLFFEGLGNSETITPVIVNRSNWYNKFNGYPLFSEVKKDGIVL